MSTIPSPIAIPFKFIIFFLLFSARILTAMEGTYFPAFHVCAILKNIKKILYSYMKSYIRFSSNEKVHISILRIFQKKTSQENPHFFSHHCFISNIVRISITKTSGSRLINIKNVKIKIPAVRISS